MNTNLILDHSLLANAQLIATQASSETELPSTVKNAQKVANIALLMSSVTGLLARIVKLMLN
jgi:hypothetical protein